MKRLFKLLVVSLVFFAGLEMGRLKHGAELRLAVAGVAQGHRNQVCHDL
jgi:hypothetical protein